VTLRLALVGLQQLFMLILLTTVFLISSALFRGLVFRVFFFPFLRAAVGSFLLAFREYFLLLSDMLSKNEK